MAMMKRLFPWLLLVALSAISAQEASTHVEFFNVSAAVIQERLEMVQRRNSDRQKVLEDLFREVGCTDLSEQRVPGSREPNIICAHDGAEPGVITVGAHYDAGGHGTAAVDDWSGASLLPSLYQSIETKARRHRFVFVGFSGEEAGLLGSGTYVKRLSKDDRVMVRAMVNLECLGLTPPKVWAHRADKALLESYLRVANALQVPPAGVNVDNVGDDDSRAFLNAKIPVITIHSVTQETWPILHSNRDQVQAINPEHYYTAYRLVATYLTYLDSSLP
jgi:Iap family predicted aminopeptidase